MPIEPAPPTGMQGSYAETAVATITAKATLALSEMAQKG
jgi:hypothetical protein